MELHYRKKQSEEEIVNGRPAALKTVDVVGDGEGSPNRIILGENAAVLRSLMRDRTISKHVDLVYIDPPFATNATFRAGSKRVATISAARADAVAYHDRLLGEEFIEYLRERLVLLRELLSETGSIYVHIDYKIGHYVKVMMDEVFGQRNFRNDITRIKCNPKNFARKGYGNVKDMVLFYTMGREAVWNEPRGRAPRANIEKLFSKIDKKGRRYTTTPLHAPGETRNGESGQEWKGMRPPAGRHWRYSRDVLDRLDAAGLIAWSSRGVPRKIIFADEHGEQRLQDIWEFKDLQSPSYPTEKNINLLRTIIQTSSAPGQLVLDAFCGSGTTLLAAEELGRRWIGIDNSPLAIELAAKRLRSPGSTLFKRSPQFVLEEQSLPARSHQRLKQAA